VVLLISTSITYRYHIHDDDYKDFPQWAVTGGLHSHNARYVDMAIHV